METVQSVLLIVIGWLLGLLAPAVVDAIRLRRTLKPLRMALAVDLDELQIRMADNAFYIAEHLGAFDHGMIRWLLAAYREYAGLHVDPEAVALLEQMAGFDDASIEQINVARRTFGAGPVLIPRNFSAAMVDQALAMLPYFELEIQQRLLEIRRQLAILQEDIIEIRAQYQMTFDRHAHETFAAGLGNNILQLLRHAMKTSQSVANHAQVVTRSLRDA